LLEMLGGAVEATSVQSVWHVEQVAGSPANCAAGGGQCGDKKVLALNSTPEPRMFGGLFGGCRNGRFGLSPITICIYCS